MRLPRSLVLAGASALVAAVPAHDARVQASMAAVVGPASDLLFAVGGEVDPDNGSDAAKVPPARWQAAAEAADKLAGGADLLLSPEATRPGEWSADAGRMKALAVAAGRAARAQDGKALTGAANDLGDVCTACHARYKPQG